MNFKLINKIAKEIKTDSNDYFGYAHFDSSNMADYTLMSATIDDLVSVYPLDHVEAVEIITMLTH